MISDQENVTKVSKKGQSQYPLITGEAAILTSRPRHSRQSCVSLAISKTIQALPGAKWKE